jgi:2-octaprenyl-6-methoxyphenol hydroxylase
VLGDVLKRALAATPGVDVLCPARIDDVDLDTEVARCRVVRDDDSESQTLSACLLVAADGARSTVRERLGIGAEHTDYGQHAVIGNLETEKPIGDVAYERFTEQGPLALLPMAGERAAFVWTVAAEDADRVMALDDEPFIAELNTAFGNRLGAFSRVGRRAAYPLALSKALRLTATRSVVVGNAAHGLHPVAAQGFNLGMRDVAALCDCIAEVLENGSDVTAIGAADVLARYADWRRSDQGKLVRFTDGLVRLFASRRRSLRLARDLGMLAFDLVPGVRGEFARQTMGLAGRLPRLSRGVPIA